jgi:hypothetical protein
MLIGCYLLNNILFRIEIKPNAAKHLRYNENNNEAVVESPPFVNKIMDFCRIKSILSYFLLVDYPEMNNCAKPVYFNEKPNYNTRFGKTEPYCLT